MRAVYVRRSQTWTRAARRRHRADVAAFPGATRMSLAMRLSDVVPWPVFLDRCVSAVEQRMAALWPMQRVLSWAATLSARDLFNPGAKLRREAAVGLIRRAGRVWPCLAASMTGVQPSF